jgi:hypothetical protein
MATAMTFESLKSDIQSYLERGLATDTTVFNQLPKLINNAERRITRELKILGFQTPLTNNFTAGNPLVPKPNRWRETISFNFGRLNTVTGQYTDRAPLLPRSYETLRRVWPDDSVVGLPKYFAEYDFNTWLVAPTPDQAYPFEVLFWEMPPLLDDVNQSNWITNYAPDLMLYSALMECSPFLKNDERVQTWEKLFDRNLAAVANQDIQTLMTRSTQTRQSVGSPSGAPQG